MEDVTPVNLLIYPGGGSIIGRTGLVVQIEISCGVLYTSWHAENLEDLYLPV